MIALDTIKCRWKVPWPEVQDREWHTTDLICRQGLFELREDGTLWHYVHDTQYEEDDSSPSGCKMTQENFRWQPHLHDGVLRIYTTRVKETEWTRYWLQLWMRNGKVRDVIPTKQTEEIRAESENGQRGGSEGKHLKQVVFRSNVAANQWRCICLDGDEYAVSVTYTANPRTAADVIQECAEEGRTVALLEPGGERSTVEEYEFRLTVPPSEESEVIDACREWANR